MKIIVASKNEIKVNAVKELLSDYKFLSGAKVISVSALSGVSEQPLSLGEAIQGAKTRARNAFINCSYSFGIESGLMKVPESKTGYMDVCVCSIYDGREYHLGLSCAFESPPEITRLMAKEGMDMSQAYHHIGLTDNSSLGAAEGAIGILTKGRLPRKDQTKQAIITALIHLENPELF